MNNINLYDVIRNPVITEKATLISENGQVIFDVSKGATKAQIKEARNKQIDNWSIEPWMGMVRVSFGLYNTISDIDNFIHALKDIIIKQNEYSSKYKINSKGDYEHNSFNFSCQDYFSLSQNVKNELNI